jgi:hypothetical protein
MLKNNFSERRKILMSNKPIKILTEEGLRILWNQISLDDYPNNDLLIAVLDGIDATKADKTEVADAKQEAIDAAAQDATDKDVIVLSEAQSYADDLNTTYDEKIKGYIDNKDFYQIVNNPFIPISTIGIENSTGTICTVDLNELIASGNFESTKTYGFINDKNYSIFIFKQNDKQMPVQNAYEIVIRINFDDTSSLISVYHQQGYYYFNTSNGVTTITTSLYGTTGDKGTVYKKAEVDELLSNLDAFISDITSGSVPVAKAEEADHATSSDSATSAETAEEAKHALSADTATTAGSATKATQDASGNVITETYETKADASAKLDEAKSYADGIKNDLLNGAGEAYDTLKELGDLIDENHDAIDALEIVATGKADKVHSHEIADVNGLQGKLDEIASTIVQPDWEQTDKTASDFIKNKPEALVECSNEEIKALFN